MRLVLVYGIVVVIVSYAVTTDIHHCSVLRTVPLLTVRYVLINNNYR